MSISAPTDQRRTLPKSCDSDYKEKQLTRVKPRSRFDSRRRSRMRSARGAGADSQASAFEIALLPPDNAPAFTKVVQRIPVRIALDFFTTSRAANGCWPGHLSVLPKSTPKMMRNRMAEKCAEGPLRAADIARTPCSGRRS